MINRTLDNRYTILEHVGGGGMADVYRAHDKLLDRYVAVKILRSQFTSDEEFVTRFRREAQAAARLSHHNIVNIYDVGCDENIHYIVMEYISGQTLKDYILNEAPMLDRAVSISLEIAEALEHAHQNNIVHCDIKPHNILVTRTGRVKVTDFGIARAVTSATMTHTSTVIGSVHYFSPEQAKGGIVSAKSDIYSLGVVLYEMLTGTVPFNGETPISVALKHIQEEPQPPRNINPDIPPLIEAVVLKAMAKNPEDRFSDIAEMIKDLRRSQNYLRDNQTRKISNEDFPTQILPKIDGNKVDVKDNIKPVKASTQKATHRNKTWLWGVVFLLFIGIAVGSFLIFGKFWSTNEVIVPNVVGKTVDAAKDILTDKNLRVSISQAYDDKVPSGKVISQYPEGGSTVKEQRTITLIVSKGGEITAVPDLRGLTRRDAELQIRNAGLVLGKVEEQYNPDIPAQTVISQNPRPPAQVTKNTQIDLLISKGAEPAKITLPDFRGTPLATVSSQLESLHLKLGKVTEELSDKYPAGVIVTQNPAPLSSVTEGTAVDFVVAKGSASSIKRAIVQITVPEGISKQNVQIVITDSTGRRIVYENVHRPGDKIEKAVEGTGQVRIQVYINGALLQEQTI